MFSWWNSLEAITSVNTLAQWIFAIAGVIVALGGVSVLKLSARQSELQDAQNKQVEAARVAQIENLEAAQQPWSFSMEQWKIFTTSLEGAPRGRVAVEYIRSDEKRVYDLTIRINEKLKDLGYDVWGYIPGFQQAGSAPLVGIMIQVMGPETEKVGASIQQAFAALNIPTVVARRSNQNHDAEVTIVWVGSKP